jgi:hypothetical protein
VFAIRRIGLEVFRHISELGELAKEGQFHKTSWARTVLTDDYFGDTLFSVF